MEQQPTQQQIEKAVEEGFGDAVHMLEELVALDSLLNNETGAVHYMEKKFRELGLAVVTRFPVRLEDIQHLPGFSPVDWPYDNKECVVGTHVPATKKGKSLILNGHLDVVPTGPAEMWTTGPFQPSIREGRLYGRGSGDMKAGVASYYAAMKALHSLGYAPAAEVHLQAVVEEECTGNGALACCAKGYKADAVVIPEPFASTIVSAQLGVMWLKIKVRGRPAHVLDTSAGVNGIEAAHYLYSGLRELEEKWNTPEERKACPLYDSIKHPINFNLGVIHGGEWASSVPTDCSFEVRIGFFPGKKLEDVRREVEDKVAETAKIRNIGYTLEWRGFQAEGCIMDQNNDMMKLLGEAHKKVTKQEPTYVPVTCTTDARFYNLYYNIPATCYGPEAKSIHGIDESVSLESMKQVTKTLAVFIAEWCGLERKQ